jgi:hypothetical protein
MMTIIAIIVTLPLTIIFCIITSSQYGPSLRFIENYILTCVDSDNNFYGNPLYNSEVSACATLIPTNYCQCYYKAPLYLDIKKDGNGHNLPIYGSNACVQLQKKFSSCSEIFDSFKNNTEAAFVIDLTILGLVFIFGTMCAISLIYTACFHHRDMNARSRVSNNDDTDKA